MNGIFIVTKTNSAGTIIQCLAHFAMSKVCVTELGEPVLYWPDAIYYLCECNGEIIGFAAIQKSKFLRYLYTDSNFRGMGCGSELLKNIESDFNGVKLECTSTNNALSFYLKRGWKIKSSFKNYHKLTQ